MFHRIVILTSMTDVLETSRLILRPLVLEDAARVQEIFPQWEIVKHLTAAVPWPFPDDGVRTYYRDVALPAIARGDEWHWTLRLKTETDVVIGSIALLRKENHNRGFWMGVPWQGLGLMTEAVEAVTEYWFDVLGFSVLRSPKAVTNAGSRRISEKTGMRLVATEMHDYVCGRMPSEIWEVTAEEWRTRRAAQQKK